MPKSSRFQIEGMRCEHCSQRIKSLLEARPGVQLADVSLENKEARVLYDNTAVSEQNLKKIIEEAGYNVVG